MNHEYINQFGLVDEYLMGRLPRAESQRFEEHFVDCPDCVARLKLTGDFIQDLRSSAFHPELAEEAVRPPRRTLLPFFQASWSNALAFTACTVALLIAGCLVVGMKHVRSLRAELDRANATSAQWEDRYGEQQRTTELSEKSLQTAEKSRREIEEKLGRVEARLQQEQQRNATRLLSEKQPISPRVNVPDLVLRSYRSGEPKPAEIELPNRRAFFRILIPLEGDINYKDYRMTISGHRQKNVLWKEAGFVPDNNNSLTAFFRSSFLKPGDYDLDLEGYNTENEWEDVGSYTFQVKPASAH